MLAHAPSPTKSFDSPPSMNWLARSKPLQASYSPTCHACCLKESAWQNFVAASPLAGHHKTQGHKANTRNASRASSRAAPKLPPGADHNHTQRRRHTRNACGCGAQKENTSPSSLAVTPTNKRGQACPRTRTCVRDAHFTPLGCASLPSDTNHANPRGTTVVNSQQHSATARLP